MTDQLDVVVSEQAAENNVAATNGKSQHHNKVLLLGGAEFGLRDKLPLFAIAAIDKSSRDGDISGIVHATAGILKKTERQRFLDFVLDDDVDDDAVLTIEDFQKAMDDAMELIAGRPLDK